MAKKRLSVEQIIGKLREAELLLAQGQTVPQATKKIGVTEQSYNRWRTRLGSSARLDTSRRHSRFCRSNDDPSRRSSRSARRVRSANNW